MDKILKALYEGEIYPAEQYLPLIEEYKDLWKKNYQKYEDFIKKVGSPLDKEFIKIMDEQLDAVPLELSEMFIDGFRLGARMMIEIFEDKYQNGEQ
ncbi:DUF6809 family protein [Hespellia stercorisuis]|uniref:Uncharacterized protein n=1 Tax=Hespellia stercorisuis DSM 15480 TaxID=1121950 RepID=A0A1M6I8T7_9FIRM|nr:DUF6809 family protein [Hespellia stercorisuis]SHJ30776.1 hypothetical protein SAMN02745243_00273 [Hespellia stercorisuis DSM 15480]